MSQSLRPGPFKLLLLVAIVIAAISGWWPKPVPPATLGYYGGLLCHLVRTELDLAPDQFSTELEKRVKAGNSSYSLTPRDFEPKAADVVIQRWQKLTASQQQQARQYSEHCMTLIVPEAG